jgi:hypothetical protein
MAMTGFFYTFTRPRTSLPMSMLKYDPIGKIDTWKFSDNLDDRDASRGTRKARMRTRTRTRARATG